MNPFLNMTISIQPKLLLHLIAAFFLFTIIGTLSHEAGHWLAIREYAKPGSAHIDYRSFSWEDKDGLSDTIIAFDYNAHSPQEQREYENLFKKYVNRQVRCSAGGPLLTIITGLIGVILLIVSKKTTLKIQPLSNRRWLYVFLALFWLRPVYILLAWILMLFTGGRSGSDEIQIAAFLGIPSWITIVTAGLAGTAVVLYVFFRHIPQTIRPTFLLAAVTGCPVSYIMWFYIIGPRVMP